MMEYEANDLSDKWLILAMMVETVVIVLSISLLLMIT